jgi:hypothetical protein
MERETKGRAAPYDVLVNDEGFIAAVATEWPRSQKNRCTNNVQRVYYGSTLESGYRSKASRAPRAKEDWAQG